jgi:hypothetical protein
MKSEEKKEMNVGKAVNPVLSALNPGKVFTRKGLTARERKAKRMIKKQGAARIRAAEESPIKGRGLNIPSPSDDWFERVLISPLLAGCTSRTCRHFDHDPAAFWSAWIPTDGVKVTQLGRVTLEGEVRSYFLVSRGMEKRFLILRIPKTYWAYAGYVDAEDVPKEFLPRGSDS